MTVLSAEDFATLEEYMANPPELPPHGKALMREVARRKIDLEGKCNACPHLDCCRKRGLY